jgi:hypothetical protein
MNSKLTTVNPESNEPMPMLSIHGDHDRMVPVQDAHDWQKVAADVPNFATGGVTILLRSKH